MFTSPLSSTLWVCLGRNIMWLEVKERVKSEWMIHWSNLMQEDETFLIEFGQSITIIREISTNSILDISIKGKYSRILGKEVYTSSAVKLKKGYFTLVPCLQSWEKNSFGPKITCIPCGTNPIGNIVLLWITFLFLKMPKLPTYAHTVASHLSYKPNLVADVWNHILKILIYKMDTFFRLLFFLIHCQSCSV